jgi:hypothetical protein
MENPLIVPKLYETIPWHCLKIVTFT